MRVAVPKETAPGERRVALVPETVSKLGDGFHVQVERGAGAAVPRKLERVRATERREEDAGREGGVNQWLAPGDACHPG